ncbi:hypothetical protein [Thalassospira lucentensis]|uniref:hypothetical protein n=1 Tax=Thalassospira lucentensis TaxID=168935 RepID=UPI00399D5D73
MDGGKNPVVLRNFGLIIVAGGAAFAVGMGMAIGMAMGPEDALKIALPAQAGISTRHVSQTRDARLRGQGDFVWARVGKTFVFAPISCDLMLHSGQSPLMNTGSVLYVTQFGMAGALL